MGDHPIPGNVPGGFEIFSWKNEKNPMTVDTAQLSEEQQVALDLLADARRVLLTGHEAPDGDCIGAQTALSRMLRSLRHALAFLTY